MDLFTDPGASSAQNTQVIIPVHERVHVFDRQMLVDDGHFQIVDLVFVGKFPEFTLVPVAAECAARRSAALERAGPVLFAWLAMEADEARAGMPA